MKNNTKQIQIEKQKNKSTLYFVIFFVSGLLIGYLFNFSSKDSGKKTKKTESDENQQFYRSIRESGFKFISPLLDCDYFEASNTRMHLKLKSSINDYINTAISHRRVQHISLYYRHLNNGPWIGVNEHHNYTPASLMKVPIIIGILKKAQDNPQFLKTSIPYNVRFDTEFDQNIGHNKAIMPGNTYTIEQLIDFMTLYSDNEAAHLLHSIIENDFEKILRDLGVDIATKDITKDFITVKEYSSFFRILYNASYLNREMSEKALEILSKGDFNDGIPAKLPKGTQISHKFGERGFQESDVKQLHDCGIVYKGNTPYLICIMSQGTDFNELIKVIAELSEIVYLNHQ
jgi:beta-lactamase class A